ncbi:copper resistance protein NlpE [Prevotella sp. 10(H)]|uniref:copper resistance protein NlpE n=1 Tax=Prevotella sp. 10(H) TaxID=1158294 RepID=UPI0004A70F2A|nr:copper resistance protein NlpE [Prevotella sp. 10(H)]
MKKLFVIIAAMGMLYSCGGGNAQKNQEEKPSVDEFSEVAKNTTDQHNAKNSLDYKGTYTGKVPTASGEGMIVSIKLDDSTYVKNIEYVGKKNSKSEEKGKYTWNPAGNTVILDGVKESPNQYFVGENMLTQLDMEGNRITGEMADMYILKK